MALGSSSTILLLGLGDVFDDPERLSAVTGLIEVLFIVVAGLAGGAWAITRWTAERAATREANEQSEIRRLEEQRREDKHRREERASELIRQLGTASTGPNRMLTAMALALYPDETLPLLASALGHFAKETSEGVELALVSFAK